MFYGHHQPPTVVAGDQRPSRLGVGMVVITCTECGSDLVIHCGHTSCTWLRCRSRECEAEMYDLDLGRRLMRGGVVEAWGEA